MSLRTRLIAGLLVLAALGLVLLAGVTYAEQRHFLINRLDDQLELAVQPRPPRVMPGAGFGYAPPADVDGDGDGHGPNGPGGPAAGTWSIVRSASGGDRATCFSSYESTTAPTLPA